MAQKRKRYDEQFEIAAARVALGGKTRAVDLARKLGIEDSTLLVPPALVGEGHGIARATGRLLGGKGRLPGNRQRGSLSGEGALARRACGADPTPFLRSVVGEFSSFAFG